MTDVDLMSDLQVWLMLGLAVIVWAVLLRSWWISSRPRRRRHTYERPAGPVRRYLQGVRAGVVAARRYLNMNK